MHAIMHPASLTPTYKTAFTPNRQYVHSWATERWRLPGIVQLLRDLTGIAVQFKPFQPLL